MSPSRVARPVAQRLALASGNRCAFPGCGSQLWLADRDLLLGEICHVRGDKPGALRHDPTQSDEERHGFGNLLYLCRNHHAEVDNPTAAHTAEELLEMKRRHEASVKPAAPPESIVEQLAGVVGGVGIVGGRNVTSVNQMGGQTAWSITNEGPQPRRITRAAGDDLLEALRTHTPESFQISWMMDAESGELGAVLRDLLQQGGWRMMMEVPGAMLSGGPPRGVIVETSVASAAVDALIGCSDALG